MTYCLTANCRLAQRTIYHGHCTQLHQQQMSHESLSHTADVTYSRCHMNHWTSVNTVLNPVNTTDRTRQDKTVLSCPVLSCPVLSVVLTELATSQDCWKQKISKLFCVESKCSKDYWKQSSLVSNSVHTTNETKQSCLVSSCQRCGLGINMSHMSCLTTDSHCTMSYYIN